MPRTDKVTVEFRDPPPPKRSSGATWLPYLTPLLKTRSRWAMIKEFENPDKAHDAQNNLSQRKVSIPNPDHNWTFAARGCELFAIYRGPFKPEVKRRTKKPAGRKPS